MRVSWDFHFCVRERARERDYSVSVCELERARECGHTCMLLCMWMLTFVEGAFEEAVRLISAAAHTCNRSLVRLYLITHHAHKFRGGRLFCG